MGQTYIIFFPLVKVFEPVSAELCLETVEILTRGQTKTLLDEIGGKTGIKSGSNPPTHSTTSRVAQ